MLRRNARDAFRSTMETRWLIVVSFCICVLVTICGAYQVALVEYSRQVHNDFGTNINTNLNHYLRIIEEIMRRNQHVDLIAFPEGTLVFQLSQYTQQDLLPHASRLPDGNLTIPCLESNVTTSFYVRQLSCASKTHRVYISSNIIEKTEENEFFNTNIVFDRQGRLVSKYRKQNPLSIEQHLTAGSNVEFFETDFGVSFGVLTCFDIFFREAFDELLRKNVDAVIFPSYWYSELPYLSSTQVQHMWSFLHNKVLLASGGNNGTTGTSGSGIYLGRRNALMSYLSSESTSRVLIADVAESAAREAHANTLSHVRHLKDFRFIRKRPEMHTHFLSKYTGLEDIDETLCDKDYCCTFKLKINDTSGLALTIYNGVQEFIGFGRLGIQLCAVLQCEDDKCFSIDNFEFSDVELKLALIKEVSSIYTFGFYGRNYDMDELKKQ